MIASMTGFGKGEAHCDNPACNVTAEITSVNRKQLEIRWNLPREFAAWEIDLRNVANKKLSRGAVSARVTMEFHGSGAANAVINQALLEKLIETADHVNAKYELNNSIDIAGLMRVPGVVEPAVPDSESEELKTAAVQAVNTALDNLIAMRNKEGAELEKDLRGRIDLLKQFLEKIKPLAAGVPTALKQKLIEKITAENLPVDTNDERLLKEVLLYADKADITEEITRLESHFRQFDGFLAASEPVGRSLDFLLQEMFREITTLGNKAGSSDITPIVVAFKSELEKIREQVQNIE